MLMTAAISLNNPNIETRQTDNTTRPEFSGGTTLLAVMALYALQNLLLKVMKLYSNAVAEQKNTSLAMAAESGKNIKDAGAMQATSMILAGVGSIAGAALAVGFTMYGSKALKQTQAEMKSVNKKLSIVDKNLNAVEQAMENPRNADASRGKLKTDDSSFDRSDWKRIPIVRYNAKNGGRIRFEWNNKKNGAKKQTNSDAPEVVSHSDLRPHLKTMEKTKFEKVWDAPDHRHLQAFSADAPELMKLDKSLRSEQKSLHKRMDTLSGEHNSELNKATQRGQLSNSAAQGIGQTSSGVPHVAKGEYDSAAQFTKAVGEQIESSSRQSEEARNQTLQSANHINQILDQLKAAEKAN